jgi:P27 family predicted phage terminase small subunit
MAGRPPKPSALKLVAGNPGKRAANKQEPDPKYLQDLTAPVWLPSAAKEVWDDVAPKLATAKLLTEIDVMMLCKLCIAEAQYRYAVLQTGTGEDLLACKTEEKEGGEKVEAGKYINPWSLIQSMTFKQQMTVLREFGMSPAARSRVQIQPQGDLFGNGPQSPAKKYF